MFHYPGWSKEVLQLLYEKRGIKTTDTDPGSSTTKDDYSLESNETNRHVVALDVPVDAQFL